MDTLGGGAQAASENTDAGVAGLAGVKHRARESGARGSPGEPDVLLAGSAAFQPHTADFLESGPWPHLERGFHLAGAARGALTCRRATQKNAAEGFRRWMRSVSRLLP